MIQSTASYPIETGWKVAVILTEGREPQRCYVGRVETVTTKGFRLCLFDWIAGDFLSWDFVIPWRRVDSIHVCTDEHDEVGWIKAAARFQTRANRHEEPSINSNTPDEE
jgi:hypothetical protein